jgi:23S rRNA-/tRNA-specific pseudouridylate synthase
VADDGDGRAAHTGYRVLRRLREVTLVEARIHTGRTHQIRVHFQYLGFPMVGDHTYGQRQNARLKELTCYAAGRQMLHASQLTFTYTHTRQEMVFEAPRPEDYRDALHAFRVETPD